MKAGIGSYAFRYAIGSTALLPDRRMTLSGILDYCNNERIEALQVCDNLPLHQQSDEALQDCLSLSEKYSIELEIGTTGYLFDHLQQYIVISGFLKSKILRTVLNANKSQGSDAIISAIRKIIPVLESKNITLAIENHFDLSPLDLAKIIEDINHPLVKICIDPLNSISLLWGRSETFRILKNHIVSAHAKDVIASRKGTGFLISGCKLGEGSADIQEYLMQINQVNPHCNVFLEQWMDEANTIEDTIAQELDWVNSGISYLKNAIHTINTDSR